jgi:hypothetical protein
VNTGTVNVSVAGAGVNTTQVYSLTPDTNSFSNTCPLMVNWIEGDGLSGTYGVLTSCTNIVTDLYINKPPSTSYAGINLSSSGAAHHPLGNCRFYYSQITLDPQKSITYLNTNLNKKIVYRTFVSNQYNNIAKSSNFNQLINSGIVHPTGVLVVPFIGSQSTGTDRGFGDSQWKSPFDLCPATGGGGVSLTNLQVSVGGQNVLGYWECRRWYYVNIERSQLTDKLQPRIIYSNVPIDVMVFIFYSDEFVVNVETGIINEYYNISYIIIYCIDIDGMT